MELSHDSSQNDFQLQDRVFPSNARSWASRERNKRVEVSFGLAFRQEIVGIVLVGVRIDFLVAMQVVGGDDDGRSSWKCVIAGCQLQVSLQMSSDVRNRRVNSQSFQQTSLEVFHFQCVLERDDSIGIAENSIHFRVNFGLRDSNNICESAAMSNGNLIYLNILVNRHQRQKEARTGRRRVVAFKHYRVDLVPDFLVGHQRAGLHTVEQ